MLSELERFAKERSEYAPSRNKTRKECVEALRELDALHESAIQDKMDITDRFAIALMTEAVAWAAGYRDKRPAEVLLERFRRQREMAQRQVNQAVMAQAR